MHLGICPPRQRAVMQASAATAGHMPLSCVSYLQLPVLSFRKVDVDGTCLQQAASIACIAYSINSLVWPCPPYTHRSVQSCMAQPECWRIRQSIGGPRLLARFHVANVGLQRSSFSCLSLPALSKSRIYHSAWRSSANSGQLCSAKRKGVSASPASPIVVVLHPCTRLYVI